MHKWIKRHNVNFHSDGLLDNDARKVPSFLKRIKHLARALFTHSIEVTESLYVGNIFLVICLPKTCTKT